MTRPDDLVTLREAARLVGRSTDTVRRWRREHGLRDFRDKRDPTAPSLFSQAELHTLAAQLAAEHPDGQGVVDGVVVPVGAQGVQVPARPAVVDGGGQGLAALVRETIADLRAERDRLAEQLAAERTAHAATRAQLGEAMARIVDLSVRVERGASLLAYGSDKALRAERRRLRATAKANAAEG